MGENNKITNYKKIKSMKLEEFAEWLDKYGSFEDAPWEKSFDKLFCSKCEGIPTECVFDGCKYESECSYCELYTNCKYFDKEMNTIDIIKWWLKQYD